MTEELYTIDDQMDLALAAELQAALLPKACPTDCPHEESAARNRMCGSVGGDFYDFIRANDDQIVIMIGDVVGHGIRAAMVMARLMGYLHSKPPSIVRPKTIVEDLNDMLIELGQRTETPPGTEAAREPDSLQVDQLRHQAPVLLLQEDVGRFEVTVVDLTAVQGCDQAGQCIQHSFAIVVGCGFACVPEGTQVFEQHR